MSDRDTDYVTVKIPTKTRDGLRQFKEVGGFNTYAEAIETMGRYYKAEVLDGKADPQSLESMAHTLRLICDDLEERDNWFLNAHKRYLRTAAKNIDAAADNLDLEAQP